MSIGRRQLLRGALSTAAMASYSKISLAQSPKRVSFLLDSSLTQSTRYFIPQRSKDFSPGKGSMLHWKSAKGPQM